MFDGAETGSGDIGMGGPIVFLGQEGTGIPAVFAAISEIVDDGVDPGGCDVRVEVQIEATVEERGIVDQRVGFSADAPFADHKPNTTSQRLQLRFTDGVLVSVEEVRNEFLRAVERGLEAILRPLEGLEIATLLRDRRVLFGRRRSRVS